MNICAECKHHQGDDEWMKCTNPKFMEKSPVTGRGYIVVSHCLLQRKFSDDRYCGPDGRWFEPLPEPPKKRKAGWWWI